MEEELQNHKEWIKELENKSQNQGSPNTSQRNLQNDSFEGSFKNERIESPEQYEQEQHQNDDSEEAGLNYKNHNNGHQNSNRNLNKKNVKDSNGQQSRWEQLYQLNQIQKDTKEYFYQALKKDGESKELSKCTFKPKLNKKSKQLQKSNPPGDFFARKNHWRQMKEAKLKQISENKQDKELLHCTFQPQILGNNKAEKRRKELIGNKPAKALNTFIERQKLARKEKFRKKAILNGERSFNKRIGGTSQSYMSKFVRDQEGDDDEVLKKIRNCSFSNAVLCLHRHLNSFDISLD